MPHATAAYLFEYKICGALAAFSVAQFGGDIELPEHGFLMLLDDSGQLQRLVEKQDEAAFASGREGSEPFLLFDPFEAPQHTYIQWRGLSQGQIENLLHVELSESDFISRIDGSRLMPFPESRSVMF